MNIDCHFHTYTEPFVARFGRSIGGPGVPAGGAGYRQEFTDAFYRTETVLAEMERMRLDVALLSPPPPLFAYQLAAEETADVARLVNGAIAASVRQYPKRFRGLGTVPLQDPAAAVIELERCLRDLGLNGVEVGGSVNGKNLDEPDLFPFWQKAEALGAFVLVHPSQVLGADRLRRYYLTNLVGNPSETGLAAASLVFAGVFERLPGLKVCFAHGGGTFAYILGRLDHGYEVRPEPRVKIERPPSTYVDRVYADSITHDGRALRYLVDTLGADHVVLGSDFPFDMGNIDPVSWVEGLVELTGAEKAAVLGGNAAGLLGL